MDPGWGEGCAGKVEEKVGGCWQRERKQRQIVSCVQGSVCEILGCISSDWHMLGIGLPFSE